MNYPFRPDRRIVMRWFNLIPLAGMMLVITISCSGSVTQPVTPDSTPETNIMSDNTAQGGPHSGKLWGVWEIYIDADTGSVQVIPLRGAAFTANITGFVDGPPSNLLLDILGVDVTPDFTDVDVDVSLRHPFPGLTIYTGFDVIGVFMGNGSGIYPGDGNLSLATENDQTMLNPDGYTRWFNAAEFSGVSVPLFGYDPGTLGTPGYTPSAELNPYKYYADGLASDENAFSYLASDPTARGTFTPSSINTRHYDLRFPTSTGIVFQYAVIAHWEAPSGSGSDLDEFPLEANAEEALLCDIVDNSTAWYDDGDFGGSVALSITPWDWSATCDTGEMDEYEIRIFSDAWTGAYDVMDTCTGLNDYFETFGVDIPVENLTSCDPLPVWIEVWYEGMTYEAPAGFDAPNDADGDLAGYFHTTVEISCEQLTWINVTYPNGGEVFEVGSDETITWESAGVTGTVKIEYSEDDFVSDFIELASGEPNDGSWDWLEIPCTLSDNFKVRVTSEINELITGKSDDFFSIISVGIPEFPVDITPPDLFFNPYDLVTIRNQLYAGDSNGLRVFDVESPQSPVELQSVTGAGYSWGMTVADGYAYLAEYMGNFIEIIDIDPLETAHIVGSVQPSDNAAAVAVSDGYAYVADYDGNKLHIIDVDPPESAYAVTDFDTLGSTRDVIVSGDYAYVVSTVRFYIFDISDPESAFLVNTLSPSNYSYGLYVSDGYAYIANQANGLMIYDVDPPESASLINTVPVLGIAHGVEVRDGFAYIAARPLVDQSGGLRVIDIDPIESAYLLSSVDTPGQTMNLTVQCSYAFLADLNGGLRVIELW